MTKKLYEYNLKRDFDRTFEPQGKTEETKDTLRFAVQHHMARNDHYDLRLEWDGTLLSWAVPKGPSFNPRDKRLAVRVEDHPLEYRNFEGTIPKGEYGGGTVMLWDEGTWEPLVDVETGLKEGSLKFILNGRRLKGGWALVKINTKEGDQRENWLLIKEKDKYSKDDNGISKYNTSIRTGRTMQEIEKGEDEKIVKNPFDKVDVQLAKLVNTIPDGEGWLFELKYDGYRIVSFIEGNTVRLVTRNGNNYTDRFSSIASALLDWAGGRSMVLDGEMVVTDQSGKTDFQALQNYMKNPKGQKLTYIIFDLLALDGKDLRQQTLSERKKTLENLMQTAPGNLHYSKHVEGNGEECFKAACSLGMEGIIGKKADSVYSGTRNGDWIKLKCEKRQEFVIGGFTLSDKKARGISSLLLGAYDDEDLVYVGRAGTGFSQAVTKDLLAQFEHIKQASSPFKNPPSRRTNEKIIWLQPNTVAEIRFSEWTKDNLLRQASFKGLRTDKSPKEIQLEKPKNEVIPMYEEAESAMGTNGSIVIKGIKITNPDKIIFDNPKITKADVVSYYAKIAPRMLPYVSHRILSVVRCPKGITQTCFYKKHPATPGEGVVATPVPSDGGTVEDYFYIENELGLISEAQMGTLEFHIWGSRVDQLEKPDMMVFDLDPDEGMDVDIVRQGVRELRGILSELSLNSYLKTSGGKGYHVVVPLKPAASWEVFYDFARRIAEVMEHKWPDRYTSNSRKAKRTNKIFIDWIRNGRGATSIAPYSLRAREGARVSMPISWEELDTIAPDGIDMQTALIRLDKEDPWKGFFENEQRLNPSK
ncbi:MAG TPA: DNA ligase D [Clostridiales bacterium]|nr:DNA ligase D [Clostridiales bacterium]